MSTSKRSAILFLVCVLWATSVAAQDRALADLLALSENEIERLIYRRAEAIATGKPRLPMPRPNQPASQPHARVAPPPPTRASLEEMAAAMARTIGLPRNLAFGLIRIESNWNARALSPKGAMGLTQVLPSTARGMGMSCDLYEPMCNLRAGFTYLRAMLDIFKDPRLALAAYNAGPGVFSKRYPHATRVGIESYVLNVISAANRMQFTNVGYP